MALELFIGGCSGTCSPSFVRQKYGNLTTSFGIINRAKRIALIIDNGTGVQRVVKFLQQTSIAKAWMFQTHFHHDHMEGIQHNQFLFNGKVVGIMAPVLGGKDFSQIYSERFDRSAWPVCPEDKGMRHQISLFNPGNYFNLDGIKVETLLLNHPGGSVAYRVTDGTDTVVIATDNELTRQPMYRTGDLRKEFSKFVSGANVLVADAQYREEEYNGIVGIGDGPVLYRRGWGHSTPKMLAETLSQCTVMPKQVLINHHDPARADLDIEKFEKYASRFLRCTYAAPTPIHEYQPR